MGNGMATAAKTLIGCTIGCVTLFALTVVAFVALAVITPEDDAIPGSQMPGDYLDRLTEMGALKSDEKIVYFYTIGLVSIEEGGSFYTDRSVVHYMPDGDDFIINAAAYEDIASISPEYSDNWADNTIITIEQTDGTLFNLEVSTTEGADKRFVNRLLDEWEKHRGEPEGE